MPGKVAVSDVRVSRSDDESSESSASSDAGRGSGGTSTSAQKRKSNTALASSSKRKKGGEKDKATVKAPVNVTLESSGSGSGSGSEDGEGRGRGSGSEGDSSDDDDDDTSDSDAETAANTNGINGQQSSTASPSRSQTAPKKSYQPPAGFERVKAASRSNPKLDQLFLPSNLEGKQVWHITVPSSVSIDSLNEVEVGSVKNGKTVLSHKGVDYGFASERSAATEPSKLLIAGEAGKVYRPASSEFTEVLHLQQIVGRPSGPAVGGSKAAATVTLQTVKEVRQQPQGLRVRFWPVGFEQGDTASGPSRPPTTNGTSAVGSDAEVSGSEEEINNTKRRKTGSASHSAKRTTDVAVASSSDSDSASESDEDDA